MRRFDSSDGDVPVGGGGTQRAIPLPDGVVDAAAGAELAVLLDDVPVERVSGHDTVEYMKAAYRLATHYQGLFLKALLETGLRLPAPDDQVVRTEAPGEFAAEEARAALVWSRSRAEGTFGRAYQVFGQNSQIGTALLDATLDEPRAKAFCNWTAGLADEHARRIIDELLPVAPKLTVGELIDRIKRMAIALDPEWAERRYRDSVRERRVELRQTPDGTADLSGRDLPADRAKTGADRIHKLAQACKTAGDKRRIDTIRADLFLGMLDGQYHHMTDEQIVEHVLANPIADDPTGSGDDDGHDGNGGCGRDGGGRGGGSGSGDDTSAGDGPDGSNGGDSPGHGYGATGDEPTDGCDGAEPSRSNDDTRDGEPSASGGPQPPSPDSPGGCAGVEPNRAWNVREMRVELSTLLGLDEHPAELPGLGYVPAGVARSLAARMGSGEWRFVICTPDGVPICSGITMYRPAGQQHLLRDRQRGGIVELQFTTTQLFELATAIGQGHHLEWQRVIGDIVGRYRSGVLDNEAGTAYGVAPMADPARSTNGDGDRVDHSANSGAASHPSSWERAVDDARRRRARAGLRRWIEVRDRYCLHPACRMPATQTDQDHRTDYATGGLTVEENLDSHCRHDHRLQHDGGWTLTRPAGSDPLTGTIVWASPLGHRYESRPPPVMQPYPEPGSHYPGGGGLPTWFTDLVENVKAAQRAAANTAGSVTDESATSERAGRRTTKGYPAKPPF